MKLQPYVAELLGTFTLTFGVYSVLSSTDASIFTPFMAALILGLFVYTVGPISGAHLNPAITFALATLGKIKTREAVLYIVAQAVGALLAWGVLEKLLLTPQPVSGVQDSFMVGFGEALGAFMLAFGVASVVNGNVKDDAAGITIGGSLLMGIFLASGLSNGVLNPAVALGIGSISVMYVAGPLVGAAAAMWLYRFLKD